jgi:hypothetical protein
MVAPPGGGPAVPAAAQVVHEQQWHLDALRIDEAHAITTATGVVVAVWTPVWRRPPRPGRAVLDGYGWSATTTAGTSTGTVTAPRWPG